MAAWGEGVAWDMGGQKAGTPGIAQLADFRQNCRANDASLRQMFWKLPVRAVLTGAMTRYNRVVTGCARSIRRCEVAVPIITLTTDFGLTDGYVAAMKGVIVGLARRPR